MTSTRDLTSGTFVLHYGKAYEVTSKSVEGDNVVVSLYRDYDMTEDTVVVPVADQDDVLWHTC